MRLAHDAGSRKFALCKIFARHHFRAFPPLIAREDNMVPIQLYNAALVGDLMEQRLPDVPWEFKTHERNLR